MKTLLLFALVLPAAAQAQVHKCTVDGKVTYSQAPCERGQAAVIAVPDAPAPDPGAKTDLARQKREAKLMEKERLKREAHQDREDEATHRVAAKRRDKCQKLKQDQKWAEEDARGAQIQNSERAQIKARRVAERYKLECGS
ncbi:DUF4124 domain-containing protein [Pseudoduganella sp. UC29_106]|uniref:DUF4124 domain-containing protein n=1 Tax=Pseudoduganella sp. UC29_106 TaxID=3374553 RepID=UPI003758319C